MKKITKIEGNQDYIFKPKTRVVAYCRVSTDSDDQLVSLHAQKSHYETYIKANSEWDYAGLYYDEGISGTKKENRSDLLRLLSDCESGMIDLIITKSVSRFARNTTDCLEMVRKLLDLGVHIYFEKENINTGSMESELMLSILSGLAESESVSISENAKWAIQRRFQNGTFKISYPPYGYENIDGQMIVNPEQAEVVRYIFAEVLSGKGTQKIADDLNQRNIPTKRGGHWTSTTIRGILKNEKYTGDIILQKTYTDFQFNKRTNNGEKNKYLIKNHHEAIISYEVFEAAEAALSQRAKEKGVEKSSDKYQMRYPFSGKIICSECGSTFKRRIHSTGAKKYIAWCCSRHLKQVTDCSMQFIRDEDVKTAFVTMINKLIYGRKIILKPLLDTLREMSRSDNLSRIQELDKQIEKKAEQKELLVKLMAKGYLEPALFNRESNELRMELENYIEQKEALIQAVNGELSKVQEVSNLMKFTNKAEMIDSFDDQLFNEYVERIVVFSRTEIGFMLKCEITLRERI
ncbi:recombinase family protein [Clostridium thermarum]|uniref:recombinase family protein n=1 Tax=Clostridium thermarum TaxID=1716543 RepID=UPI00111E23DF|nr:recombinase family protein [Clostridium thermarum]